MHLNLKHLQYFWAVAHEGNLTRAAAMMNLSQSALSIQIQKLEDQVGSKLFERKNRQLILTEAGTVVLDHADRIFKISDELKSTLEMRQLNKSPLLKIGTTSNLSRNFQLYFVQDLLTNGDVKVSLKSGSLERLVSDLERHRLDVILSNSPPARDADSSWTLNVLSTQRVSLIAVKGLAERAASWQEIIAANPILLPSFESGIRTQLDALIERHNITPSIVAESDDMAMLRLLIKSGAGVGVVPPIVVQDELSSGALEELAVIKGVEERFYAISLVRQFPNPIIEELISRAAEAN